MGYGELMRGEATPTPHTLAPAHIAARRLTKSLAEGLDEGAWALIAEIERGGRDAMAFDYLCRQLFSHRFGFCAPSWRHRLNVPPH